jgi:hypothetical protein
VRKAKSLKFFVFNAQQWCESHLSAILLNLRPSKVYREQPAELLTSRKKLDTKSYQVFVSCGIGWGRDRSSLVTLSPSTSGS